VNVHFKQALYSLKRALHLSFVLFKEPYILVQNCYLFSTGISTNLAMCTVMVIHYHCGQTFSTHLDWGEGRSPVRRWCGVQPRDFFSDVFGKFLLTNSLVYGFCHYGFWMTAQSAPVSRETPCAARDSRLMPNGPPSRRVPVGVMYFMSFILSNLPSMIARICCGLGWPPSPRCAALNFA